MKIKHKLLNTLLLLLIVMNVTAQYTISTIAGSGVSLGYNGDGGLATSALLNNPRSITKDNNGNIFINDYGNGRIRKIDVNGIISTVYTGQTYNIKDIEFDALGNLYILDGLEIKKMDTNGNITSIAGALSFLYGPGGGFYGDGGPAVNAAFFYPEGIFIDAAGNIYIADTSNKRIRKIDTNGIITTIVGTGNSTYNGDGILATAANLAYPRDIVVDAAGNMYISDTYNYRIRKIDNSTGLISTFAGTGVYGAGSENVLATTSNITTPGELDIDNAGVIYFADISVHRVRKINTSGIINTIAGTTVSGFSGDGGPATCARLTLPTSIYIDNLGNGYIADQYNSAVRKLTPAPIIIPTNSIINTCLGSSINLTANSVSGATYLWNGPNGFASSLQNPVINNATLAMSGIYTVRVFQNGCLLTTATVQVTVNTIPTITSTTPATRCDAGSITLLASSSAGTLNWYTASSGGTLLGTGTSYTTNVTASTIYYVEATNNGCTSARTAVTATVNTTPSIVSTTPATRCDAGSITVSATASAGTLNWYSAASGGTLLGTGTSFTTNVTASTTYYVEATSNGCTSARTAVTATVNTTPSIVSTTPATRCDAGSITVSATASAGTLNWYTAPSGGTLLAAGTSYTTNVTASITYYVEATSNGCTSARTTVTATLNTTPSIVSTTPATRCDAGSITLLASSSAGTLNWYTAPSGGTLLGTGTSFTTNVTATTTYYVEATDNGCTSARTSVDATVNTAPVQPGVITGNNTVCEGTTNNYSIANVSGATSYTWAIPTGATLNSGQGTNTINVTMGITSGDISVTASNVCGTSMPTNMAIVVNLNVVIVSNPVNSTINTNGNTSFTVTANNATSYQWQVNIGNGYTNVSNGGIYSGATTNVLTLTNVPCTYSGAQYRCVVSGLCQPATTTAATLTVGAGNITSYFATCLDVTHGQQPSKPLVVPNNAQPNTDTDVYIIPFQDNCASLYTVEINTSIDFTGLSQIRTGVGPVPVQTDYYFQNLAPATYYVRVSVNGQAWGEIRKFIVPATAPRKPNTEQQNNKLVINQEQGIPAVEYKVYPNPTNGKFIVELEGNTIAEIKVFDMLSREVFAGTTTNAQLEINLNDATKGLYTVQISSGTTTIRKKIIIN